jgi:hypothetical protein
MTFDTKSAAKMITDEVAAAAAMQPQAAAAAVALDFGDFCGIWSKVKPILEMIAGIASFIPGLGGTAGAVLKGLIKVGDTIYAAQCG